jgi:hypothetical protein
MIHLESVNPTGDYHLQSVIVGDVHSIHVDKSYSVLNVPLGSSYDLLITYQDSFGRSFPSGFTRGMNSAVRLSNSKVLVSELDATNSTLTLTSQYVGDTMVTVYMLDDPTIKDVFQVSVSSIMKPISPITLHLGDKM